MAKETLTFDAKEVKITPNGSSYFHLEVETEYPDEIMEDFNSGYVIQYCKDNILPQLGTSDLLNHVKIQDAVDYYGSSDILDCIPQDVIIKYLRDSQ